VAYTYGSQTVAAAIAPVATKPETLTALSHPTIVEIPATHKTQDAAVQHTADKRHPPAFNHFAHSPITGFLSPSGFSRSSWQPPATGVAITAKPIEAQRFVVLLDPGHGGIDPGAMSPNGLVEKHLTLDIAQRTRLYLSQFPSIDVILTRETDQGMSRLERIQKIKNSNADLLISLHFNDLPQTDVALVETFYAGNRTARASLNKQQDDGKLVLNNNKTNQQYRSNKFSFTQSSQQLAAILQRNIFNEIRSTNSSVVNAGVKKDRLFVLTGSNKPSALIELTCLSNPAEANRLITNEYRNRLSKAIADGILQYHQSKLNITAHKNRLSLFKAGLTGHYRLDARQALTVREGARS